MIPRDERDNASGTETQVLDKDQVIEEQFKAILTASMTRDARLPRRIKGGFNGLEADLERLRLDWAGMLRTLDQLRLGLGSAEQERDRLVELLSRAAPDAQEASRALKSALESAKAGDLSQDIAAMFSRAVGSLEALEGIANSLTMNVFAQRSAWEQYARAVIQADRMRSEVARTPG